MKIWMAYFRLDVVAIAENGKVDQVEPKKLWDQENTLNASDFHSKNLTHYHYISNS